MNLKAPLPWFGGKSRVAHLVWQRFGNPLNYVEPFAGSLAVLLSRPDGPGRNETANDKDCYLSNFWRALQHAPEELTRWADWPVNEADLHSRHRWLVDQKQFRERMLTDPDYYDPKIAGWWVWGISLWIGSGWCVRPEWSGRAGCERSNRGIHARLSRKMPDLKSDRGVHRQIPNLKEDKGIAALRRVSRHRPESISSDLLDYMQTLADRLRRVRICCGEWDRVLGPSATTKIGLTGVLLDPPYGVEDRSDVYGEESRELAHQVREWALAHGNDPLMRIALCGYQGEHDMPPEWECVAWKANGGYGNQSNSQGRENTGRERIWFSPHCLRPQEYLFPDIRRAASDPETNDVQST